MPTSPLELLLLLVAIAAITHEITKHGAGDEQ